MDKGQEYKRLLAETDFSDGSSIERYALHLKGMTFRDVLDLGITPPNTTDRDYNSKSYKGGMGNLLEERYFGYRSNSDERPDFPDAGVELKATCFDIRKKDREPSAGERLVLTMIPSDEPIEEDLFTSHLWNKCKIMLLVFYLRDRSKDKYDQTIEYVTLFTPSSDDLKIIQDDYRKIVSYIRDGRADELSEGLTTYLGAATKGATEATMWRTQYYPHVEEDGTKVYRKAKRRAFSFKRQYMDYILHHVIMHDREAAEKIVTPGALGDSTFEDFVTNQIALHIGKADRQLAEEFNVPYTANKAQWTTLAYRMLGIKGNHAEEFMKAGISVRVVRIEENNRIKESLSFAPFEFEELLAESWDDSEFRSYLDETRFFFVVFRKVDGEYRLAGSMFWNMPVADIEGEAKRCWEETREVISHGVELVPSRRKDGKLVIRNNLPGISDNPLVHVRPHAQKAAYKLSDGTVIGDIERNASRLPDGRWMTRQSFWFNNKYLLSILNGVRNKAK
ncbi:Sau3AI family type II restriction endonuclease [Collinsella sp. An2]|uniref:Sau3AI family type II restriction endonuclease n=1 Tax=Collinsella sp. An2 TaxID=1965585 RepID=UPI000B37807D|nr:Sau3AI family type II restriction endonuclease [Collinsella sp. An2]OUP06547.1 hypothetical protein B5F33_09980 [Collinsella sp. An2]